MSEPPVRSEAPLFTPSTLCCACNSGKVRVPKLVTKLHSI